MIRVLVLVSMLVALPCPAPACSLCGPGTRSQDTFREDIERAGLVVYGAAANPRFIPGNLPGAGATDLVIEKVLKYDPVIAGRNSVTLDRYIPVLDVKDPPRFVIFCNVNKERLTMTHGRQVRSKAV